MNGLLKICVWFTEKMCVWQAGRGPGTGRRDKTPFGGEGGRGFGSIGSRYVHWNTLDSSKTIENWLLKKIASLLRIVAFLVSSEKVVGSLKKNAIPLKKK